MPYIKKTKYQKNHPENYYRTSRADCMGCPLAPKCIGKMHEKEIRITAYKEEYDRALIRVKGKKGQYYKTLRRSTVEPVFGSLINFTGMRKINTRGIESANKGLLMAAMAYNLKKLLKHNGKYRVRHTMEVSRNIVKRLLFAFSEAIYTKIGQFLSRIWIPRIKISY